MSLERVMQVSGELALSVAVSVVGALAWLFNIQTRVSVLEEQHKNLSKDVGEVKTDMTYVRGRVDDIYDKL
jgi:hypothetical protein